MLSRSSSSPLRLSRAGGPALATVSVHSSRPPARRRSVLSNSAKWLPWPQASINWSPRRCRLACVVCDHPSVGLLAVKLTLAPAFVVGASLAARRFGPRIGGLVAGLPVVAGPILLVYALTHGTAFAADAAAGTLLGLISLTAFVAVYGRLAGQSHWLVGLLAGWSAFVVGTLLFSTLAIPVGAALLVSGVGFLVGLKLLPNPRTERSNAPAPPI